MCRHATILWLSRFRYLNACTNNRHNRHTHVLQYINILIIVRMLIARPMTAGNAWRPRGATYGEMSVLDSFFVVHVYMHSWVIVYGHFIHFITCTIDLLKRDSLWQFEIYGDLDLCSYNLTTIKHVLRFNESAVIHFGVCGWFWNNSNNMIDL